MITPCTLFSSIEINSNLCYFTPLLTYSDYLFSSKEPGRIWPGKKMAGHMGNKSCTLFAIKVSSVLQYKAISLFTTFVTK